MADEMRWLALESNPDVMNKYIHSLGVGLGWQFVDVVDMTEESLAQDVPRPVVAVLVLMPRREYILGLGVPDKWQFTDVWGFDPELLAMVPRPVCAVLLLFPLTKKTEEQPIGQECPKDCIYFMKQTIGNACGTVGLIHALCNNTEALNLDESKHLYEFFTKTKTMSPEEKGKHLETDKEFSTVHEGSALEGQTAAPSLDDKVNLHFVAFIHHDGGLYELDGRKKAPVHHGATTADSLLEDTALVVKKFMARDPEELNFTVVALTQP